MANGGLGPLAPLLVAAIAVIFILIMQPVSGDIMGFPGNLFAAAIVAVGGVAAAAGA